MHFAFSGLAPVLGIWGVQTIFQAALGLDLDESIWGIEESRSNLAAKPYLTRSMHLPLTRLRVPVLGYLNPPMLVYCYY